MASPAWRKVREALVKALGDPATDVASNDAVIKAAKRRARDDFERAVQDFERTACIKIINQILARQDRAGDIFQQLEMFSDRKVQRVVAFVMTIEGRPETVRRRFADLSPAEVTAFIADRKRPKERRKKQDDNLALAEAAAPYLAEAGSFEAALAKAAAKAASGG